MKRALILGLTLASLGAPQAQAVVFAVTSEANAHARIEPAAGIDLGNNLTLPAVSVAPVVTSRAITGSGALGSTSSQTTVVRSSGPGNAQLTIRGQPGDVVSTTVPESFTVVRSGGQETLTVKTNTNAEFGIGSGDVVLGGAILNGNTMSVDIGGALTFASGGALVPGPYEGMLVVVVQYN
ncbi:DUF4402 domain-containing protein [Phenylobacterium sp.]|uniref:DUF4402 domain-containing protein n=1 Tax=Phenylobacterium sp. TaxID=1871053 RepID=UPI0039364820